MPNKNNKGDFLGVPNAIPEELQMFDIFFVVNVDTSILGRKPLHKDAQSLFRG